MTTTPQVKNRRTGSTTTSDDESGLVGSSRGGTGGRSASITSAKSGTSVKSGKSGTSGVVGTRMTTTTAIVRPEEEGGGGEQYNDTLQDVDITEAGDGNEHGDEEDQTDQHDDGTPVVVEEEFTSIWVELRRFARISAPNTLTMLLMNLQSSVTLSVAALHLGTEEMTGVSLANLTANLSCLTLVYGLLSAVDTLAPQAFAAGNLIDVGILVQRGIVTIFATFSVTFFIWFNAESLLLWVGQPPDESRLAGVFLRYFFLAVPGLTLWESARRFMWAQEVTQWPFVAIALASLLVHLVAVHTCIPLLGFPGAPIAHVITNWSLVGFFALWVKLRSPHSPKTWIISRERVMDRDSMKSFMKLGIAGIGTMTEWIFFEAFVFISGELGETALAANSILYTLIPMCYTLPSGLSIATTTRVGALLAQGKVRGAKQLTRNVAIVTMCVGSLSATVVWLLRDLLISAFSLDPNVQALARSVWPRLCIFILLDALFGVQCGLLRALGMQVIYAGIVFACLFLVGLPIIASLAFPWGSNMGLEGMWLGMPGAYVLLDLCLFGAAFWRNWKNYSDAIVERERLNRIALEGFVPT